MPFTPDVPFPKSAGDPIRSKDWNDLVTEARRLDTAKVERAGDAITGPLSIAGALAVGKAAAAAGTKLDVLGGDLRINDNNLVLRGGADSNHGLGWFGLGKLFAGANVDGPVLYGFSGGALGTTNGGQKAALNWDLSGRVGIGVPAPGFKVDIGDRIRLRQGSSGDAGLWLYQNTPAEDRAFVGMSGDNAVGLWGNKGAGWGMLMDVSVGTVGIRGGPISAYGLYINPAAVGANPALAYGMVIGGGATGYGLYVGSDAYIAGRARDQRVRSWLEYNNAVNTTSTGYVDMPNLSLSVTAAVNNYFQITLQVNGVQTQGSNTIGGYFRLLVDGGEIEHTRHEFNNNGWELRGIYMSRIVALNPGSHTITAQWATTSGTLTCCWYNDFRRLTVIEL